MKTVLVLVLSADFHPYDEMINTSLSTWDSIDVDGVKSIYYCCGSKPNTDKIIYLNIPDGLFQMGRKTLMAFEWVLNNIQFDYLARVNSSCYVRKKQLFEHCQTLPETIFQGLITDSCYDIRYLWGGGQYIISRNILEDVVKNKDEWRHDIIEDVAMSDLVVRIGYNMNGQGNAYSINKVGDKWNAFVYGVGENMEFTDFKDLSKLNDHYFVRVKQDQKRNEDKIIMEKLFENDKHSNS